MPQFHSTGAAMSNALAQLIAERKAEQRQAMLDELLQEDRRSQIADRAMNRDIQQQRVIGEGEDRALQQKQIALQMANQKFSRGLAIANAVPKGAPMTPELEEALGPLAGTMTETTGGIVPGGEGPTELRTFRGTQDAQEFERGQEVKQAIAQLAAENKARSTALAEEVAKGRMEDAQSRIAMQQEGLNIRERLAAVSEQNAATKADTKVEESALAESSRKEALTKSLELIEAMEKDPGMGVATGAYEMRGFTQPAQDFKSRRDQLLATLAIPNLPTLKGPLSDKDIAFIKQSVTRLANSRISEEGMRQELATLKAGIMQKLGGAGANAASGVTVTPTSGVKPSARELIEKYRRKP